MLSGEGSRTESLRGHKAQESTSPRPGVKNRARNQGNGFPDGMKPLKRRHEAFTGFLEKRRSGKGKGDFPAIIRKEKGSEG